MSIQGARIGVSCDLTTNSNCLDKFGCPSNVCPDFTIRRHDVKPPFRLAADDCDGPLDLTDPDTGELDTSLVLEANMWAIAKLKTSIDTSDTYFRLADDIGFEQVMVGDIIIMDRVRLPEHMLVTGFDETNKLIQVQRGYNGTNESSWKKGSSMRIFRVLDASAVIELVLGDITQEDGTTLKDQLLETLLVYNWNANNTCLPGCYWFEFKLLKMEESVSFLSSSAPSVTPSFTPSSLTPTDFGCTIGSGVEWVRRFPTTGEGFLIHIPFSPTTE
jgi:hypothetical protein